jgi:molybdopterin-biosynthesis enzyme MoeA-like protein
LYTGSQTRFFLKELFFSCEEDILAKPLARVQREFPSVQVGSYPDTSSTSSYRVRITFESTDRELVEKVG